MLKASRAMLRVSARAILASASSHGVGFMTKWPISYIFRFFQHSSVLVRRVTARVRGRPSDRLSRGAAGIQAEDVYVATTRAGRKSDPRYPDLVDTTTSSENRTDSREGPKTLPKTSYVATVRAREDCCRFMRALFRGPSTGVKTLSPRPCNHRLQI